MIDISLYKGIASNSKEVREGYLFFASKPEYVAEALEKGAKGIVAEFELECSVPTFKVANIRKATSDTAANFYPLQPQNIVAVTGTNGKTSTVNFVREIIELLGQKAASIGTIGVCCNGSTIKLNNTTPGAIEVHKMLEYLAKDGVDYAVFEASSHGLDQHRIDNVRIKAAGFTNLTRDHIDYHKDMENYFNAKAKLFTEILPQDGLAILNADVEEFEKLAKLHQKFISYGKNGVDLRLIVVEAIAGGQHIIVEAFAKKYELNLQIYGHFQVMNLLCAVGLVYACGFSIPEIMAVLPQLKAPEGRLDFVGSYNGAEIFVDYAHTPDALENAINALKSHVKNRMVVVFGCGGNRDAGKRPMMGKIASDLADMVFVTDDNPRFEDALTIRKEILSACPKGVDGGDREQAIKSAIAILEKGDVLLVAGKGHENEQIINGVEYEFSDIKKIKEIIK